MSDEKLVLLENDGEVSIVTLNRPDKLNAINPELRKELLAALQAAEADEGTAVVLLRASGRSFCVGYDIARNEPSREAWRHDTIKWNESLHQSLAFEMAPWNLKKPVIAAVQGHVLGGGCELAMMCDLTIAADNAVFGEPEIRFSNVGPAIVMPWIIGLKKARELLYFGDTIDAKAALELGMINKIVPAADLQVAALRYAKRLALISPEALYCTKLAINRGAEIAGFRDAMNAGVDLAAPLYAANTKMGAKFKELTKTDGLGAALKWRGDQFKE
jgi:enoyl-CoA hydratase/carnithine racemase